MSGGQIPGSTLSVTLIIATHVGPFCPYLIFNITRKRVKLQEKPVGRKCEKM
jgi:hypothetical protein